jgi:hypothetical protein
VLDEAARQPKPEAALLNLKICDPACGSGHFLIAAAHRLAKRLAFVRTGEEEPPPEAVRSALRDVIGRCVYGVDLNPMAVELCKVALWMEALVPGKPLSFLDHHIQCGNSLLGATPALLARGIPDEAFEPIEGDDKALCRAFKRQNRDERRGQGSLYDDLDAPWNRLGDLAGAMQSLEHEADNTMAGMQRKQERYSQLVQSSGYLFGRLWADAWCGAFVWRKDRTFDFPITERIFRQIERSPHHLTPWMRHEVQHLAEQYQFFHWHLAFPDVFRVPRRGEKAENEATGWNGGFDVVLGNPPWERIKLQEQEWFAQRRPDITKAGNATERRRIVAALADQDPALYRAFLDDRRKAEGEGHLVRDSCRYPLCGRGDVNTYALFAETNRTLIQPTGRVGCIVPSGIATDDTTKGFFRDLMRTKTLLSMFSFFEIRLLFPDTDSRNPFCLLTLTGPARPALQGATFVFNARTTGDLEESQRRFTLSDVDLVLLNPNTLTCPVLRSPRDAELTKTIYRRMPVLVRDGRPDLNPWGAFYLRLVDYSDHAHLLYTRDRCREEGYRQHGSTWTEGARRCLPVYESKLMSAYDHRFATYASEEVEEVGAAQHADPQYEVMPRYWVEEAFFSSLMRKYQYTLGWFLAYRDVARPTDTRTLIAAAIPRLAASRKLPVLGFCEEARLGPLLLANFNSFVTDYMVRQKMGGTSMGFFILKQLPVLSPTMYSQPTAWTLGRPLREWLLPRVLELVYTSWDLQHFAVDCGWDGPPFRWDVERRFLLRCELDAAFFHLYGISQEDTKYILDTFPVVKRKDEQETGEYRTKRVILEVYDALAEAARSGQPYQTRLDPPPADPRMAHPAGVGQNR